MERQEQIIRFILTDLLDNAGGVTLAADDNLMLGGQIDSLGVIKLVNFLEKQFGVKIRPGEITLKNFKTVNRMVDFIDRKLAES
jgi:acyl carrier protein